MGAIKGLLLVAIFVLGGLSVWRLLPKVEQVRSLWEENQKLGMELARLKTQGGELSRTVQVARQPRRLERQAKQRLQVRRPGEQVVVIITPLPEPATTTPEKVAGLGFNLDFLLNGLREFFRFNDH